MHLEEPWTLEHNQYSAKPEGNAMEVAKEVIDFLK